MPDFQEHSDRAPLFLSSCVSIAAHAASQDVSREFPKKGRSLTIGAYQRRRVAKVYGRDGSRKRAEAIILPPEEPAPFVSPLAARCSSGRRLCGDVSSNNRQPLDGATHPPGRADGSAYFASFEWAAKHVHSIRSAASLWMLFGCPPGAYLAGQLQMSCVFQWQTTCMLSVCFGLCPLAAHSTAPLHFSPLAHM